MYAYCYLVLREHSQWFGGDSEEVTPVPMPNTEVKLFSADGSRGFPPVRVGRRQAFLNPVHDELGFLYERSHRYIKLMPFKGISFFVYIDFALLLTLLSRAFLN